MNENKKEKVKDKVKVVDYPDYTDYLKANKLGKFAEKE